MKRLSIYIIQICLQVFIVCVLYYIEKVRCKKHFGVACYFGENMGKPNVERILTEVEHEENVLSDETKRIITPFEQVYRNFNKYMNKDKEYNVLHNPSMLLKKLFSELMKIDYDEMNEYLISYKMDVQEKFENEFAAITYEYARMNLTNVKYSKTLFPFIHELKYVVNTNLRNIDLGSLLIEENFSSFLEKFPKDMRRKLDLDLVKSFCYLEKSSKEYEDFASFCSKKDYFYECHGINYVENLLVNRVFHWDKYFKNMYEEKLEPIIIKLRLAFETYKLYYDESIKRMQYLIISSLDSMNSLKQSIESYINEKLDRLSFLLTQDFSGSLQGSVALIYYILNEAEAANAQDTLSSSEEYKRITKKIPLQTTKLLAILENKDNFYKVRNTLNLQVMLLREAESLGKRKKSVDTFLKEKFCVSFAPHEIKNLTTLLEKSSHLNEIMILSKAIITAMIFFLFLKDLSKIMEEGLKEIDKFFQLEKGNACMSLITYNSEKSKFTRNMNKFKDRFNVMKNFIEGQIDLHIYYNTSLKTSSLILDKIFEESKIRGKILKMYNEKSIKLIEYPDISEKDRYQLEKEIIALLFIIQNGF